MNQYVSSETIKMLRTKRKLTQTQLAEKLNVSDKTVSKWETAKGLPDITLIEPLAQALGVSVIELMSGDCVINQNKSCNMLRSSVYVCPVCRNVIHTSGKAVISCCGVNLPSSEAEECDVCHDIHIEMEDREAYVTIPNHPMSKSHNISFIAYVTSNRFEIVKHYPEGSAEAQFEIRGNGCHGIIYAYCNHHGLFGKKI
jgi:DNA-binding XRE family transcriptional regulator/desulfoferrodoxin (superoxide reductase-like protein)